LVKRRYFARNHIPHNIVIDAKVAVNQVIAHPGHCTPLDCRILLSKGVWHLLGGFANYFNAADECPFQGFVLQKCRFIEVSGRSQKVCRLFKNVL
jgi:hypothetical protein